MISLYKILSKIKKQVRKPIIEEYIRIYSNNGLNTKDNRIRGVIIPKNEAKIRKIIGYLIALAL